MPETFRTGQQAVYAEQTAERMAEQGFLFGIDRHTAPDDLFELFVDKTGECLRSAGNDLLLRRCSKRRRIIGSASGKVEKFSGRITDTDR